MNELEKARRNLYILMESGDLKGILEASKYLDKLILQQTHKLKNRKSI